MAYVRPDARGMASCPHDGTPDPMPIIPLRDEIRDATRAEHHDIEARMDLMRPDFGPQDYTGLLQRYLAFHTSFERFLHAQSARFSPLAEFYQRDRMKAAWLASDLKALGMDSPVPAPAALHPCLEALYADESHLLGGLYVIEGSMLGGAVLSRQFGRRFDLTPESGLKYFSGYGSATREKWSALLQLLSALDHQPEARRGAVAGAKAMFRIFQEFLATR